MAFPGWKKYTAAAAWVQKLTTSEAANLRDKLQQAEAKVTELEKKVSSQRKAIALLQEVNEAEAAASALAAAEARAEVVAAQAQAAAAKAELELQLKALKVQEELQGLEAVKAESEAQVEVLAASTNELQAQQAQQRTLQSHDTGMAGGEAMPPQHAYEYVPEQEVF